MKNGSMSNITIILRPEPNKSRDNAKMMIDCVPDGYVVSIKEGTRSLEQNAMLWAVLNDISKQVKWYGQHLTDYEWKDVLTAALKKEKVVPGINGGFVVLGQRTSKMSKKEFAELLEIAYAFGTQQRVKFKDTTNKYDEP